MPRQQETTNTVYNFIVDYRKTHRKSPTVREIAKGCYLSTGSIMRHVDWLEAKGRIEREPNQPRSIVLTKEG